MQRYCYNDVGFIGTNQGKDMIVIDIVIMVFVNFCLLAAIWTDPFDTMVTTSTSTINLQETVVNCNRSATRNIGDTELASDDHTNDTDLSG